MNEQEQLIQAFMLDLGIVLGAKSELEALLTGLAAVLKLGKNAAKLFQAWGQAESQLHGAGKQVIAEALGGGSRAQLQQPLTAQAIGSMAPTYNAAPTPTPYGDAPRMARLGAKLSTLNGHCPEGYEVEKHLAGGCVRCRKGKRLPLALEMKCGGKKRIRKSEEGNKQNKATITTKNGITKSNIKNYSDDYVSKAEFTEYRGKKHTSGVVATGTSRKDSVFHGSDPTPELNRKRFYQHKSIYEKKLNGGTLNVQNLYDFFKCGGKTKKKKCEDGGEMPINASWLKTATNKKIKLRKTGKYDIGGTFNLPENIYDPKKESISEQEHLLLWEQDRVMKLKLMLLNGLISLEEFNKAMSLAYSYGAPQGLPSTSLNLEKNPNVVESLEDIRLNYSGEERATKERQFWNNYYASRRARL